MRSQYCNQLDKSFVDKIVTLCGWVNSRRDHGGVIFIDLRDASGIAQIVFDPSERDAFALAEHVRGEFVMAITGQVRLRPSGTENPDLPTGEIEVVVKQAEILNKADPLPFQIDDVEISESVRLKYRFLDLRRPMMQNNIKLRHRASQSLRRFLEEQDFLEIETPMLTKSTPEGARDYLVPSRTHGGHFFALPQSPQLFKQILMISGFERYFQITRCFRDEDLRADRQPEFTQLDIEMAFVDEQQVMAMMEQLIRTAFKETIDVDLVDPVPKLTYAEAVSRFGVDRPDLRIPLELVEVSDLMQSVEFKVFSGPANSDSGRVAALRVAGGQGLTRKQIDDYTAYVGEFGAKGLAYIKVNDVNAGRDGLQSPILKFLPDEVITALTTRLKAKTGDLLFFGADHAHIVNDSLGALRIKIAHDLNLVEAGWKPVWITDFPMFEYDGQLRRWKSLHHPFTAPQQADGIDTDPGNALSRAYDLVLNGVEIGGGSIRIHDPAVQSKVFAVLGISEQEAKEKFGFLLDALRFGAPPHGGIAFGLDRIVAMMVGMESIRDVIAFPKTQKVSCLLTNAPSVVADEQLRELNIKLRKKLD